ncbi:MAG: tetratricopeptide repeat protein [Proteobacteria bacterium]|nr:tetratricopeptide repeat protein [Pseudomonadota bacterium]
MTSFHTSQIAAPKYWEQFEDICLDLFRQVWGDPMTQKNGRQGQAQAGTDVYGQPAYADGKWYGIQCKGKDAYDGSAVTETELRKEIEKAKMFKPALTDWTLATTAKKDAKIETLARTISEEHVASGLFAVHLLGWEDLQSLIGNYDSVMENWYPDQAPKARQILANQAESLDLARGLMAQIKTLSDQVAAFSPKDPGSGVSMDPKDIAIQAQIDGARDLLKSGHANAALTMLRQIEKDNWDQASDRVRFRLLTNQGAALYKIGSLDGAADFFFRAQKWGGDDPLALVNVALAHVIRHEDGEAAKAADEALKLNPTDSGAASLRIMASLNDGVTTDPFSLLPTKHVPNAEVIATAGRWQRQRGNAAEALVLFERSFALDPTLPSTMFDLAAAVADSVLKNREALQGKNFSKLDWKKLDRSIELFSTGWDAIRKTDEAQTFVVNVSNLIVLLRFYDRTDKAEERLNQALAVSPDSPPILLQMAHILSAKGAHAEASAILAKLPHSDVEVAFLYADALGAAGRTDECLIVNEKLLELPEERDRKLARFQRIDLLTRADRLPGALEAANELAVAFPSSAAAFAMMSDIQSKIGKEQDALISINHAKELLASGTPESFDKIFTAESLCRFKDWNSAADILSPITGTDYDSYLLRQRIGALINADRRREVIELLGSLAPDLMDIPFYRRAAATFYERAGDPEAALQHAERYLAKSPDDVEMRLLWIQIADGLGRTEKVEEYLAGPVVVDDKTSVWARMALAQTLDRYGYSGRAFETAYATLRTNWTVPAAHYGYQGLVLAGKGAERIVPLSTDEIAINTGFALEDERGQAVHSYIIEPERPHDPQLGEIAPDSSLAKRAIGLRVGDPLKLQDNSTAETLRIREIKHKYLHLLHRSLEEFNRLFPSETGMIRIAIDDKNPGAISEKLVSMLRDHRSGMDELISAYRNGPMPIAIMAKLAGKGIIEFWYNMMGLDIGIDVCQGTAIERREAIQLLSKHPKLILDPLTFWIAGVVGALEALHDTFGPLGLTTSAIETLTRHRDDLVRFVQSHAKTVGLSESGDGLVAEEPSEERKRSSLALAERIVAWATERVEIIAAIPKTEFSNDLRELGSNMDPAILDTLAATNGSGRVFLCEDHRLRMLSKNSIKQGGVWLQAAMLIAKSDGKMTGDAYYEATVNMALAGHHFITLDGGAFLSELERADWVPNERFRRMSRFLGGPHVEINSMLIVACAFLRDLWAAQKGTPKKQAISQVFLDEILNQRTDEADQITRVIAKYALPPTKAVDGRRSWMRGAFIEFLGRYTKMRRSSWT